MTLLIRTPDYAAERAAQQLRLSVSDIEELIIGGDAPENALSCDRIVVLFPLYSEGLPSDMLRLLMLLDKALHGEGVPVYGIALTDLCNPQRCECALVTLANWCEKAGLSWRGGLALSGQSLIPIKVLFRKEMGSAEAAAINAFSQNILSGISAENIFVSTDLSNKRYCLALSSAAKRFIKKSKQE